MKWKIKKIKVSELKENPNNARKLTEKGLKDLENSILKFGVAEPLVVNTDYVICGGHGRKKILERLKIKEVDCYLPEKKLSKKEFDELGIRLNKNIAGEFDFDILANEFEMEDLIEWGFDESELGLGFESNENEDDIPEIPKVAVSRLGDIFLIDGKHRVMCADSTKADDVDKLMNGEKADMVFTDPPYGINLDGNNSKRGKNTSLMKGGLNLKSFIDDSTQYAINAYNICKELNIKTQVWWGANYYCHSLPESNNWLVWDKRVEEKMKNTNSDCELAYVIDGHNSVRIFRHLWNGLLKASEKGCKRVHPTQKPIALSVWSFNNYEIKINGIVLDLFLGSGSTLIACEQTKRICYGMEIDPIYIDVILKRYKKLYPEAQFKCLNRDYDFKKLFAEI